MRYHALLPWWYARYPYNKCIYIYIHWFFGPSVFGIRSGYYLTITCIGESRIPKHHLKSQALQEILNQLEESGLFEGEVPWLFKRKFQGLFWYQKKVRFQNASSLISSPLCQPLFWGKRGTHGSSSSDTHGAKPPNEFLLRSTTLPETNIV